MKKALFIVMAMVGTLVFFSGKEADSSGPPTFDSVAQNWANPTTSLTVQHTVAGANECDLIYVFSGNNVIDPASQITSVTDGGLTPIKIASNSRCGITTSCHTHVQWINTFLMSPAPVGTKPVVVADATTSDTVNAAVLSYKNCNGYDFYGIGSSTASVSSLSFTTMARNNINDTVVAMGINGDNNTQTWGANTRFWDAADLGAAWSDFAFSTSTTAFTVSYSSSSSQAYNIYATSLRSSGTCGLFCGLPF